MVANSNKSRSSDRSEKKINIDQVVSYLNHAFSKAIQGLGNKNVKGTKLYDYQVEFCYTIDEITRGPKYIVPKVIAQANELIEKIASEVAEMLENKTSSK